MPIGIFLVGVEFSQLPIYFLTLRKAFQPPLCFRVCVCVCVCTVHLISKTGIWVRCTHLWFCIEMICIYNYYNYSNYSKLWAGVEFDYCWLKNCHGRQCNLMIRDKFEIKKCKYDTYLEDIRNTWGYYWMAQSLRSILEFSAWFQGS